MEFEEPGSTLYIDTEIKPFSNEATIICKLGSNYNLQFCQF